jgi:hypothetical protein
MHAQGIIMTVVILIVIAAGIALWSFRAHKSRK